MFWMYFNPMDCSLPGSSIHGIFQARLLEWVAIAFSILKLHFWNSLAVQLRLSAFTALASLSFTNSQSLLKLMSIKLVMPSNHLCHPLLLMPSIFPSIGRGLFQWVGSSHQVAKWLELQLQLFQWIFRVDFL